MSSFSFDTTCLTDSSTLLEASEVLLVTCSKTLLKENGRLGVVFNSILGVQFILIVAVLLTVGNSLGQIKTLNGIDRLFAKL